ncbi:MAG: glycosyltransferase family 39 protein [Pirellulales bacterium]|nr:glycosyltransferase family 39 protein [Pirellulales bacterium]
MATDSSAAISAAVEMGLAPTPRPSARGPSADLFSDLWLLALGTLGLLVPFLAKPVNMDDPLFVWTAQQVLRHPGDFYGFDVNWYGFVQPMHVVNKNPPGAAYFLAGALWVGGDRELVMHAVYLAPNIALVLGTYLLARRFCQHAVLAAVAACATPVVFVSATTLMCDNLMAALWCWSMLAWLRGLDRGGLLWFLAAGLLAAAAALCKYFGICVVPLMVAYTLVRVRRPGWWLVAAALPLVALALFEWYCHQLYSHGLLRGAVDYVGAKQDWDSAPFRLFQALIFLGGCLITIGCAAPWCWSPRVTLPVVVIAGLAFAAWTAAAVFPDPELRDAAALRWALPLHATLFLLVAAHVIGLAVSDLARRWGGRGAHGMADSLLLCLWFAGTLLFAALGNWTITARTFVPLAAPAGILLVRRLENYRQLASAGVRRGVWFAVGLGGVVALSTARADYTFAKSAREAGSALVHNFAEPGHILWFQGHWGFQYYIIDSGAQALDVTRDTLLPGDILIVPLENSNLIIPPTEVAELLGNTSWGFRRTPWIATQSVPWRGKFYATLGRLALPYVFGAIDPDNYLVFRMKQPYRFTH